MWTFSVSSFTSVIFIVTLRLMITARYFTWLNLFCIFVMSWGIYFMYVWISNYVGFSGTYQSIPMIFSSPNYYLSVFVCVMFCYLIDLMVQAWRFEINTNAGDYLRRLIAYSRNIKDNDERLQQFDMIYNEVKKRNIQLDFDREEKLEEKRDLKTNKYGTTEVF